MRSFYRDGITEGNRESSRVKSRGRVGPEQGVEGMAGDRSCGKREEGSEGRLGRALEEEGGHEVDRDVACESASSGGYAASVPRRGEEKGPFFDGAVGDVDGSVVREAATGAASEGLRQKVEEVAVGFGITAGEGSEGDDGYGVRAVGERGEGDSGGLGG